MAPLPNFFLAALAMTGTLDIPASNSTDLIRRDADAIIAHISFQFPLCAPVIRISVQTKQAIATSWQTKLQMSTHLVDGISTSTMRQGGYPTLWDVKEPEATSLSVEDVGTGDKDEDAGREMEEKEKHKSKGLLIANNPTRNHETYLDHLDVYKKCLNGVVHQDSLAWTFDQ